MRRPEPKTACVPRFHGSQRRQPAARRFSRASAPHHGRLHQDTPPSSSSRAGSWL
jgi:hypothetical protein